MKILFLTSTIPPFVAGMADHTQIVASHLATSNDLTILTVSDYDAVPITGVSIEQLFTKSHQHTLFNLVPYILKTKPDWLLIQYDPFSYEPHGLNFCLPLVVRQIKHQLPKLKIGVFIHEINKPIKRLSNHITRPVLDWTLWTIGRSATTIFFTVEAWSKKYASWFPKINLRYLPIGSNLPYVGIKQDDARSRLNISHNTLVVGLFGKMEPTINTSILKTTIESLQARDLDIFVLYCGLYHKEIEAIFKNVAFCGEGPLPSEELSRRLSAVDIMLAPYSEGVTTRRSILLAGLQHNLAVVATMGPISDTLLIAQNESSLLLSPHNNISQYVDNVMRVTEDVHLRKTLGSNAGKFYRNNFDWCHICKQISHSLEHDQ